MHNDNGLIQTTFLGASIRNFNTLLGWQNQVSQLDVSLIEDSKNRDKFLSPGEGSPVTFQYGASGEPVVINGIDVYSDYYWKFHGIIQSQKKIGNEDGNPVYNVVVVDPRELLEGTTLIIGGYTGGTVHHSVIPIPNRVPNGPCVINTQIPNLVNIYGFIENNVTVNGNSNTNLAGQPVNSNASDQRGFGTSNVNDAGMPWENIRDSLLLIINRKISNNERNFGCVLTSELSEDNGDELPHSCPTLTENAYISCKYGGPIVYRGVEYKIDLTELPDIPSFYRISSDNITLMDFINDVCTAGGHDFFFELIVRDADDFPSNTNLVLGNVITLRTVDRRNQPVKGAIERFVSETIGAANKEVGTEMRNSVTSKFVIGDNTKNMFAQFKSDEDDPDDSDDDDDFSDDTIWPFWGLDAQKNPIIGEGFDDNHVFELDSRHLDVPGIGAKYKTNIAEMRAALEGQEPWESFLVGVEGREFQIFNPAMVQFTKVKNANGKTVEKFVSAFTQSQLSSMKINNFTKDITDILYEFPIIQKVNIKTGKLTPKITKYNKYIANVQARSNLKKRGEKLSNTNIDREIDILFAKSPNDLNWVGRYTPVKENQEVDKSPKIENVHFKKAALFGLIGNFSENFQVELSDINVTKDDLATFNILKLSPFNKTQVAALSGEIFTHEEMKKQIYDFANGYATEYYGKKFMIRIPFVFADKDELTKVITTSLEPTDGGFIDEDEFDDASATGLIPALTQKLTLQDGRFGAYVRFPSPLNLNLELLDEQDYVFSSEIKNEDDEVLVKDLEFVYIKCDVDPEIVFLDNDTAFSPRVIITLPSMVTLRGENDDEDFDSNLINSAAEKLDFENRTKSGQKNRLQLIKKGKKNNGTTYNGLIDAIIARSPDETPETILAIINRIVTKPGADAFKESNSGIAIIPHMAAIPLKSNINTYGPWFAVGAQGMVEFEQDTNLVPWNFDGYDLLNRAGNAKVSEARTAQTFAETGTVTYPGVPKIQLGQILINGGPYITGINIDISPDGVTTSYKMKTWTNSFGKLAKANIDRLQRQAKVNQQERRKRSGQRELPPPNSKYYHKRQLTAHKRNKSSSSHGILIGKSAGSTDRSAEVFLQPAYHTAEQLTQDYENTAVMSLDGMFRPFSTWIDYGAPSGELLPSSGGPVFNSGDMPHFGVPSVGAFFPTLNELNPFPTIVLSESGIEPQGRCDIAILAIDNEIPEHGGLITEDNEGASDGNYRPLALRGPLVICGWGYDTIGNPVPNLADDNSSDQFASGHLEDYTKWPVGPVDLKWSHDRQLWQTGVSIREGYLSQSLIEASGGGSLPASGFMQPWSVTSSGTWEPEGNEILIINRDVSFSASQGTYLQVINQKSEFRPIYVGCF